MSETYNTRYPRRQERKRRVITGSRLLGATVVAALVGLGVEHIKAKSPLQEARIQMESVNHPRNVIHLGDRVPESDADGDYIYANLDSIAVSAQRHNPELTDVSRDELVAFLRKQNGIKEGNANLPKDQAIEFPADWGIGEPVVIPGDSAGND